MAGVRKKDGLSQKEKRSESEGKMAGVGKVMKVL